MQLLCRISDRVAMDDFHGANQAGYIVKNQINRDASLGRDRYFCTKVKDCAPVPLQSNCCNWV
jgi:hypothetical protein